MSLKTRIKAAKGEIPADLLIKNARIISIPSGRIIKNNIGISDGVILGIGDYKAKKVIDVKGAYVSSGFFDAHIHLESTLLSPFEFANTVVPMGTTAIVTDPHEIANVYGVKGIKYILKATKDLPLDVYIMLPSCVPATDMENSGARLSAKELAPLFKNPRVTGLAEVMNYPAVINCNRDILRKIHLALEKGKIVDGHAPGLSKKELNAYLMANIRSDHESTTAKEADAKLAAGLHIMVREGTCEHNLKDLLPVVKSTNAHRCMFCTDDPSPEKLAHDGHINFIIRKAIHLGLDPILAIQMATSNPADYFRLHEKQGAIAVGHKADLVVFDDLRKLNVLKVFKRGELVAENGKMIKKFQKKKKPKLQYSVNVKKITLNDLKRRAYGKKIRVIGLIKNQIITNELIEEAKIENGYLIPDLKKDILKIVVVERHKATGNISVGFVKGLGLKRGAIGSTIAHDSHNIIVAGTNDKEILAAITKLIEMKGGIVAVKNSSAVAKLPLPIAGLMTDEPIKKVLKSKLELKKAAKKLGSKLIDPYQALSFLALPVIPKLRITDEGLIDVDKFSFVPLFADKNKPL